MKKDIYFKDIENILTDKRDFLSPEAREISQNIISTLRTSNHDRHFTTSKLVLGEICRALNIHSDKTKGINQWFVTLWNNPNMEISVMISSEISVFETIAEATKPITTKQYLS